MKQHSDLSELNKINYSDEINNSSKPLSLLDYYKKNPKINEKDTFDNGNLNGNKQNIFEQHIVKGKENSIENDNNHSSLIFDKSKCLINNEEEIKKNIINFYSNDNKSLNLPEENNNNNTVEINISENRIKRKELSDIIRKKIKSKFLKYLKYYVNKRLKDAGSKKEFKFLPLIFIYDVSKKTNKSILDLTLKEILSTNFFRGNRENNRNLRYYYHNLSVLKYLEKKKILEKSGFNTIKNMEFRQLYYEYLKSREFQMEISSLKEKENNVYLQKYLDQANDLIKYFSN